MEKQQLERLSEIEAKIAKLKKKIGKLESEKEALQHQRIDEVFEDMELSETHLDDMKSSLELIWKDLRDLVSKSHKGSE